jgi:hypothetical protein
MRVGPHPHALALRGSKTRLLARAAGATHSTFAKLGKDLIGPNYLSNHRQVLSMATVDPTKLRSKAAVSEGGPPSPTGATIS